MAKEGKFEQQMNKLRDIVDRLEKGDIGLNESIGLYEEGLKLSRSLKKQLDSFEEKIDELGRSDEQ